MSHEITILSLTLSEKIMIFENEGSARVFDALTVFTTILRPPH